MSLRRYSDTVQSSRNIMSRNIMFLGQMATNHVIGVVLVYYTITVVKYVISNSLIIIIANNAGVMQKY